MTSLSQDANYLLALLNNGAELIEHGYSIDDHDTDIWFELNGNDVDDSVPVRELIDAGLIATDAPFANPMERKYKVVSP